MSAIEALRLAREAGIELQIDGDEMVLRAPAPPAPAIVALLALHKAAVLSHLRADADGWRTRDWESLFDERAAIAEFEGGLPRIGAEVHAFACCVAEWLNRNPATSSADTCAGCGGREGAHDPLLPHGTEGSGHAWLHARCWSAWHEKRQTVATEALAWLDPASREGRWRRHGGDIEDMPVLSPPTFSPEDCRDAQPEDLRTACESTSGFGKMGSR